MQRRELVRTGLFGVAAAAAGAAHAAQDAAPAKKRLSENWDVVVVGAGFAGMCAALEAAERGAKTVLLEKMNRPDGATVYSSGWIAAVRSRFQKNHPEDSPKAFFEDMMRLSHQRSDPELIKVYAEESGAGIDWLADHGTPFYLWEGLPAPELSRCLISPGEGITGGSKLIRCLMAALEKKGVAIHYNTKAVSLVKDECFNVEGVSCITPEGRKDYLARGGVILTTGRYGANEAMVDKYIGPPHRTRLALDYGREHSDGRRGSGVARQHGSVLCGPHHADGSLQSVSAHACWLRHSSQYERQTICSRNLAAGSESKGHCRAHRGQPQLHADWC